MSRRLAAVAAAFALLLCVPSVAGASTIFGASAPAGDALSDSPVNVGVKFTSDQAGYITALRFYRQASNTGAHVAHLWTASGQLLSTVTFPDGPTGQWQS